MSEKKERHSHSFAPAGGYNFKRGTERMEQFCACGAKRCIGASDHGFGGGENRCRLAAIAGEPYCKRHKERKRGPDWVSAPEAL